MKYNRLDNLPIYHRYNVVYNGSVIIMDESLLKHLTDRDAINLRNNIADREDIDVELDLNTESFTTTVIGIHKDTVLLQHPIKRVYSITTYGTKSVVYFTLTDGKYISHHYECSTRADSIKLIESGKTLFTEAYAQSKNDPL